MDKNSIKNHRFQVIDLLLVLVIAGAVYLRTNGLFWGENQYLHPDERFLVWVGTDISPVESLREYFDTANSSLNPHNQGHGFYVYGTLPMFLTRYIVEWIFGHSGFAEMTMVGRSLSALVDILTVVLVYLIATRLYDRRIGILASAFSALAVLQIQQSHFFTMDTFINFFTYLAFYFAIRISTGTRDCGIQSHAGGDSGNNNSFSSQVRGFIYHPLFLPSLGFGLALGMAVASKLNAAPMAVMLPASMLLRWRRFPAERRAEKLPAVIWYLLMAGFASLLTFRLLQPYAFSGPSLFGLKLNPQWLSNIRELRAQSSGDVDFPPAMQWARRSFWFSGANLVTWGLGLALGLTAWTGFLWAGWRILKSILQKTSEWNKHILIWGWTAAYFFWQSYSLNPSMRYQLPVYPTLAIFAAWLLVTLYDIGRKAKKAADQDSGEDHVIGKYPGLFKWAAVLLGIIVLAASIIYAWAFAGIYTRPITRIQASRWIYENIPGAINLHITNEDGAHIQPLPFPYEFTITPGLPYSREFQPITDGVLNEVYLPKAVDYLDNGEEKTLQLTILESDDPDNTVASAVIQSDFGSEDGYHFTFNSPGKLSKDQHYQFKLEIPGESVLIPLDGQINLGIKPVDGSTSGELVEQFIDAGFTNIDFSTPITVNFTPAHDGILEYIYLISGLDSKYKDLPLSFVSNLTAPGQDSSYFESDVLIQDDSQSDGLLLTFENPFPLIQGEQYILNLHLTSAGGAIALKGMGIANEGEWDDGLPLRIDGYDGFSGIYPLDLNFNMYWEDNPEKAQRFIRILEESDYLVISSSRQWGSLPRIPERFPLINTYYRLLLGCPDDQTIEWCYNIAQPGRFEGSLGFELEQVFQSNPEFGPFSINDQFAEEAFTVYDHPKVFIFKKTDQFDGDQVRADLEAVDFSQIIRMPPMKYPPQPAGLTLPDYRLAEQVANGTWRQIFDPTALYNRYPFFSIPVWYVALSIIGLAVFPLARLALSKLPDRGYPLIRTTGLLLLTYLVWLAGSLRIPFSPTTISVVLGFIALTGIILAFRDRKEISSELKTNWRYFLMIELLILIFFTAFLLVRIGNPDLWHPWKGGEKPMDFAYFNAVLKSTSFPPYDPWYAGGYLHYYYYGFVLVGTLVKWLGITPSIAYNLILPTVFALIAVGAFSIAWNLYSSVYKKITRFDLTVNLSTVEPNKPQESKTIHAMWVGLAGAVGMVLLGNLGTVKMILLGYQKLAAPGGSLDQAGFFTRLLWTLRGFVESLQGAALPYGIGDWYWIPSRVIPAQGDIEPITEFPYFTVLYGDPHAHLFALPIALLVLSVCLVFVLSKASWKGKLEGISLFLLAGLSIGALRLTNTSDFYPYMALGIVSVGYTFLRYFSPPSRAIERYPRLREIPRPLIIAAAAGAAVLALVVLSNLLYQPYSMWSDFGYGKLDLWRGSTSPLYAYMIHWGLFLFAIAAWMVWETIQWMASTPASSLRKLNPYKAIITAGAIALCAVVIIISVMQVKIAWFVLPVAAWAGILLLRPDLSDSKRFVLFLVGTGLMLTLTVEILVVVGDIGRMNTVFKFYLQVWTMLAVSAAAAFGWTLEAVSSWRPAWARLWKLGLAVLIFGTALYPILATAAKVRDRMAPEAPHSLDGMAFMQYARYDETWGEMDLSQDYQAIRWLLENVEGSPVIVEANLRNLYRWGSRYSIYTGLPGVVGWEWHQQQQRTSVPGSWISDRISDVDEFYYTTEIKYANDFLRKYNVRYIILGQQERGHYPGPGLEKFEAANGVLWDEVYRNGETVIYEVFRG